MEDSGHQLPPIALWLRRQLVRRGWKSADLVRATDLSSGTISRWLNGQRIPRDGEHIRLLADALNVHQDEILEQLNMRDGGADRMSLAVRRLAPTIDSYNWTKEQLDQLEGIISSLGKMHAGSFQVPDIEE